MSIIGDLTRVVGSSLADDLVVLANGDVIVSGLFDAVVGTSANSCARWDGSTWTALDAGTNGLVEVVEELADGSSIVGGWFTSAGGSMGNRIARWSGPSWSPLGQGLGNRVVFIATLPTGEVVAGVRIQFAGTASASSLARRGGAAWSELQGGLSISRSNGPARVLSFSSDGLAVESRKPCAESSPFSRAMELLLASYG